MHTVSLHSKTPFPAVVYVRPTAMSSYISLLLLLVVVSLAGVISDAFCHQWKTVSGLWSIALRPGQFCHRWAVGTRENSEYAPQNSLTSCYFLANQVGTCRVQNGVPRCWSVHPRRTGCSSSILLPSCRTLETERRRRTAQEEEISLRRYLPNAILLSKHAMQISNLAWK